MDKPSATIAILTDEYHEYRKILVDQIADVCNSAGFGTLCISGRELYQDHASRQSHNIYNSIYENVGRFELKGIVALSGTIGHKNIQELSHALLNRFSHIPIVSLGIKCPGITSVTINDKNAMISLMDHILEEPSIDKVAFIRGIEDDSYSFERERILRDSLTKHGMDPDKLITIQGDYSAMKTYREVSRLLKIYPDLQALVAANDIMAESAIRAINTSALQIPRDIVVTGFDDTPEATQVSPAISTVRQPVSEAGKLSARLLLEQIAKNNSTASDSQPTYHVLDAEVVLRGSTARKERQIAFQAMSKQELSSFLNSSMAGLEKPRNFLLSAISEALWQTFNTNIYALERCVDQLLENSPVDYETAHWWNNICHQIELLVSPLKETDQGFAIFASVVFTLSRVKEQVWKFQMNMEFHKRRLNDIRTNMQLRMSSSTRIEEIPATMSNWLSSNKVKRCFLVRYKTPGRSPGDYAQLIHAFVDGRETDFRDDYFPAIEVLPNCYKAELQHGLLILNPVSAGNHLFGYLLLDPIGLDYVYLDTAAQSIANALRNQHLIARLEEQAENLKQTNSELENLANFDELTGLANRLNFRSKLQSLCDRADPAHDTFALLFIDLDGFKLVNDTMGHRAGDQLLCLVSDRLKTSTCKLEGSTSFISRLGGDEFTIIISPAGFDSNTEKAANFILNTLAEPYDIDNQPANISASIGIAVYPAHGADAEILLKHADVAMYSAKDVGKNACAWFCDSSFPIENGLKKAG